MSSQLVHVSLLLPCCCPPAPPQAPGWPQPAPHPAAAGGAAQLRLKLLAAALAARFACQPSALAWHAVAVCGGLCGPAAAACVPAVAAAVRHPPTTQGLCVQRRSAPLGQQMLPV